MKIVLGATSSCTAVKDEIKEFLSTKQIEVIDVSNADEVGFFEVSQRVAQLVQQHPSQYRGIIIDEYGAGPFMVADKIKYIICAELNDEHSAKMTREHNNANVITLGTNVVGLQVAKNIIQRFVTSDYAGGRHQIRVDMLNKMC